MRILITGGAGFVGSYLAKMFKDDGAQVVAFDNLRRRGSEFNVQEFKKLGVEFVHGDIRNLSDFEGVEGFFDLVIDASAEPSVLAGSDGTGLRYLIDTNLVGTLNCLEFVRKKKTKLIFLSTSRVYSIDALKSVPLEEKETRFVVLEAHDFPGLTADGINEDFPAIGFGFRSLYGTTKLASELFIEEYAKAFEIPALINRCGVVAGPGQFGKTDQGVFTMWAARHLWPGKLQYTGFGGQGKQVRDLLHPLDLYELIKMQTNVLKEFRGEIFVASGGMRGSVSLQELTEICRRITGNTVHVGSNPSTAPVDIPFFVGDSTKCWKTFGWAPKADPEKIVVDIVRWLKNGETNLKELF